MRKLVSLFLVAVQSTGRRLLESGFKSRLEYACEGYFRLRYLCWFRACEGASAPQRSPYDFFSWRNSPTEGQGLLTIEASLSYSDITHSSGRVISPTQRSLSDNTQHSQRTDTHVFGGIRTRNTCKRAAADPRLRPRGHQDRQSLRIP
jgi:hypothetical protein